MTLAVELGGLFAPNVALDEADDMATHLVNLDAMIPRLDFEVKDEEHFQQILTVQIRDLEPSFFYNALRKPDFQRETSSWSPTKIAEFVRTFLDGDLIPAIILWQAGTQIFVIDGSHRLSALIAWVRDDYGDGETSRKFFQNMIPPEQQKAATALRELVAKDIKTYAEYKHAIANPGSSNKETIERAQRLGSRALHLQWVTGDAKKAEDSFFKINQQATPIDPTELLILKSRRKAKHGR